MKIKIGIFLIIIGTMYGITLSPGSDETVTVESALATTNRLNYDALLDSISAHIYDTHQSNTAYHEVADGVTDQATGSAGSLPVAITYANGLRAAIIEHIAQDSCHVNGADDITWIPNEIATTASYSTYKTYADSLLTQFKAHQARAHSTRYKYLMKELIADFIAHCANDTTDGGTVHYKADETFNTVAMDSTGGGVPADVLDSLLSAANVLKVHYNGHVGLFAEDGSEVHQGHVAADSVTTADATNYTTLVALVNAIKTKYNAHCARTSETWISSIHKAADATNTSSVAAVSTASGHITADTTTLTGAGHLEYRLPDSWNRMTIQYTGSSVSTGASFYHYGSVDGSSYAFIDSTSVTGNGATLKHFNTNYYPYMKIYLNKRTDGTYKIQFKGGL